MRAFNLLSKFFAASAIMIAKGAPVTSTEVCKAERPPPAKSAAAKIPKETAQTIRANIEDVVEYLEGQVKRMLDYLELPFEDDCIAFHKTERSVRTASSEQVRKPVNKDGMGRWKPYAKNLKPLLESLDRYLLMPEDISLIN